MSFPDMLVAQTYSLTELKPKHEQLCQQEWLQLITSQNIESSSRQELPSLTPSRTNNPNPEEQVQWLGRLLSEKVTPRQYPGSIPLPLSLSLPLPPSPTNRSYLEVLPQGILDQICQHVPYEDLLQLYQLSKTLHKTVDPHLAPFHTKLSFVLRAERDFRQHYVRQPRNLGCYMCHRVLPAAVFAVKQTRQALMRASASAPQAVVNLRRFCVDCGIQLGCHGPGTALTTHTGDQYWLCECLRVLPEKVPGCTDCRMICPILIRRDDDAAGRRGLYDV